MVYSRYNYSIHRVYKPIWVCLKMVSTPLYPMVLLIIIPFLNGYFIGNINPTFSDKPRSSLGIPKRDGLPSGSVSSLLLNMAQSK